MIYIYRYSRKEQKFEHMLSMVLAYLARDCHSCLIKHVETCWNCFISFVRRHQWLLARSKQSGHAPLLGRQPVWHLLVLYW